ncbi:hypothetical protein PsYK624_154640 [Phanerochaete sordida]|uniref:DUF6533 domain-containing protein n=1 Tax=Phanerochaete sordida TaxID=48140 RepID=A0A9P3GPB9_9APHY|nr:hypothetical protein PsYK624_154640 [Phanerochaete sordida]
MPNSRAARSLLEIFATGATVVRLPLVVYEYAVTIDQEIIAAWRRNCTMASLILLSSRWLMIIGPVLGIVPVSSQAGCQTIWALGILVAVLNQTVVTLFSALRVYAILMHGRRRYVVPTIVVFFGVIPIGADIIAWLHTGQLYLHARCNQKTELSSSLSNR